MREFFRGDAPIDRPQSTSTFLQHMQVPLILNECDGDNWYVYRDSGLHPTIEHWELADNLCRIAWPALVHRLIRDSRAFALDRLRQCGWDGTGNIYAGFHAGAPASGLVLIWAAVNDQRRPHEAWYATPVELPCLGLLVDEPKSRGL